MNASFLDYLATTAGFGMIGCVFFSMPIGERSWEPRAGFSMAWIIVAASLASAAFWPVGVRSPAWGVLLALAGASVLAVEGLVVTELALRRNSELSVNPGRGVLRRYVLLGSLGSAVIALGGVTVGAVF